MVVKKGTKRPRAVVVTRPTEYEALLGQHGTHGQVEFFLESREQSVDGVMERHVRQHEAVQEVSARLPLDWRRAHVERRDLERFLWDPDDVVIAVGQDGLVANLAKYLDGQLVVGINPDPEQWDGVLVKHDVAGGIARVELANEGGARVESRPMVEASTGSGHRLFALNEVFIGHCSHQSARYKLRYGDRSERLGLRIRVGLPRATWPR